MALTCDGADMSTDSTERIGLAGKLGGHRLMGGVIHHEFKALENFRKLGWQNVYGTINAN